MVHPFPIENQHEWECSVVKYSQPHTTLIIRLDHADSAKVFYLLFRYTYYFSWIPQWRGANFVIKPPQECREMLDLMHFPNLPDDLIAQLGFHLYEVEHSIPRIQILAARVYLLEDVDL